MMAMIHMGGMGGLGEVTCPAGYTLDQALATEMLNRPRITALGPETAADIQVKEYIVADAACKNAAGLSKRAVYEAGPEYAKEKATSVAERCDVSRYVEHRLGQLAMVAPLYLLVKAATMPGELAVKAFSSVTGTEMCFDADKGVEPASGLLVFLGGSAAFWVGAYYLLVKGKK